MSNSTYSAPVSKAIAYASMVPVRGPCAEMAAIPDLPVNARLALSCELSGIVTVGGRSPTGLLLSQMPAIESGLQLAITGGVRVP